MSTHAAGSRQAWRKFPNLRIHKKRNLGKLRHEPAENFTYADTAGGFSFLESDSCFAKFQ